MITIYHINQISNIDNRLTRRSHFHEEKISLGTISLGLFLLLRNISYDNLVLKNLPINVKIRESYNLL